MRAKNKQGRVQNIVLAATLATAGLLVGCGGERSDAGSVAVELKVNTPADITNESADNYDDNINGLITASTLEGWITNWEKNRPAGITGKLVILQARKGADNAEYIAANGSNVFTYVEAGWREQRSNGVITIGSTQVTSGGGGIVLTGAKMDALIKKYGIDVNNDLIVCASGANGGYYDQGRCWYTFSYWGVAQKNLAVLNGNNQHLSGNSSLAFSTSPSALINTQVSSVRDLKVDNTALYASLEDMMNIVPPTDEMDPFDGIFMWDARSLAQYSAGKAQWGAEENPIVASKEDPTTGYTYGSFQNAAPRQGHIRGSAHLEWSNVLDAGSGIYYSKGELLKLLNGESRSATSKIKFVVGGTASDYKTIENNAYKSGDTIYHFCETSARAGATLIAAAVILGIPSRLYDSGLIEWNSLTDDAYDKYGNRILASNSPWKTTPLSAPNPAFTNKQESTDPRTPAGWATRGKKSVAEVLENPVGLPMITNPYAAHTQKIPQEDRRYKQFSSSEGSGGSGGFTLPGNACGG